MLYCDVKVLHYGVTVLHCGVIVLQCFETLHHSGVTVLKVESQYCTVVSQCSTVVLLGYIVVSQYSIVVSQCSTVV